MLKLEMNHQVNYVQLYPNNVPENIFMTFTKVRPMKRTMNLQNHQSEDPLEIVGNMMIILLHRLLDPRLVLSKMRR